MPTSTIAAPAGPRALLSHLLLHQQADIQTLGAALGRDAAQVRRSLQRLARRGLVIEAAGRYQVAPARRTAVADYAEGALPLAGLAAR
jgi:predicted ArsR family transcriptional regulator